MEGGSVEGGRVGGEGESEVCIIKTLTSYTRR